jgi:hypothetical protein
MKMVIFEKFVSGPPGYVRPEGKNDEPSHMTYERIHGGIGP